MLKTITFDKDNFSKIFDKIQMSWQVVDNKVFHLKAIKPFQNIKQFYNDNIQYLGVPKYISEDVSLGDRNSQLSKKLWTEVRNDKLHPDAYRHSVNAQPLHTDGSYISDFPSSTLMVCLTNNVVGGETVFIDSKDVFRILEIENPDLLDWLISNTILHKRSGMNRNSEVIRITKDDIFINWNFYCIGEKDKIAHKDLLESFFNFLNTSEDIKSKTVKIKLSPGDSIFWKDNYCLHGRNSFIAKKDSDRFLLKCAIGIHNGV